MAIELVPFDAAASLDTPVAQATFLADALMTGDAGYIAHAIGVLARAQNMSKIAQDAGVRACRALQVSGRGRRSQAFDRAWRSERDGVATFGAGSLSQQ